MFSYFFIVVKVPFKEISPFSIRAGRLGHLLLFGYTFEYKFTICITVPVGIPQFRALNSFDIIVIVSVISEPTYKPKSISNKV
ncbi:hypothetical protein D3C86_1263700 [compost metagenome]